MSETPKCWTLFETIIPHADRVLLHGPSGTGKTTAGSKMGLRKKQEIYSLTFTEDTPAAELRGHFIVQGNEFVWMDGPGIAAWKSGGRLVANEIQRASPDAQAFCLALFDDRAIARITLPTGEVVKPAEGFSVVATMNGDPEDSLDPALLDRFIPLEIDRVHPDALAALPENLRQPAEQSCLATEEGRRLSIRAWYSFHQLTEGMTKTGIKPKDAQALAAQAVFGKRAQELLDSITIAKK